MLFLFYDGNQMHTTVMNRDGLHKNMEIYFGHCADILDINQAIIGWNIRVETQYFHIESMMDVIDIIGFDDISIKIKNKT